MPCGALFHEGAFALQRGEMSKPARSTKYSGYDLWVTCGLALTTVGLAELVDSDQGLQLAGDISLALGALILVADTVAFVRRDPVERYLGRSMTVFLVAVLFLLGFGWLVKNAAVGHLTRPNFGVLSLWLFPVVVLGWAFLKTGVRKLFLS